MTGESAKEDSLFSGDGSSSAPHVSIAPISSCLEGFLQAAFMHASPPELSVEMVGSTFPASPATSEKKRSGGAGWALRNTSSQKVGIGTAAQSVGGSPSRAMEMWL